MTGAWKCEDKKWMAERKKQWTAIKKNLVMAERFSKKQIQMYCVGRKEKNLLYLDWFLIT